MNKNNYFSTANDPFHHQLSGRFADFDTIVLGGGASGLFAAQLLGHGKQRVLVLERSRRVGKKILMSGGGKCNFTNLDASPQHYFCQNRHFVKSALANFSPYDFMAYIYRHQVPFYEKSAGQYFCQDGAHAIVDMLVAECTHAKVQIITDVMLGIDDINIDNGFWVQSNKGRFFGKNLIVATGGLSIPTLGATGFGMELACAYGHTIAPPKAGLVPFILTDHMGQFSKKLAGLSLDVRASIVGKNIAIDDALLFTHRGVSGPAMLKLSCHYSQGDTLSIDLAPDIDILDILKIQKAQNPKAHIKSALAPFFAKKLLASLFDFGMIENIRLADSKDSALAHIANTIHTWQITPASSEGWRTAEVMIGGVDTHAISSKTMQSNLVKNLYFIGEVLDVAGDLGGYNFQWAWASAHAAAQAILQADNKFTGRQQKTPSK